MLLLKMKMKLRAISASGWATFLSLFLLLFSFLILLFVQFLSAFFFFFFVSVLSHGLLCVSLQEPMLEDANVDEGGVVQLEERTMMTEARCCWPSRHSPLFLLIFTCSGHSVFLVFGVQLLFFSIS